MNTTQQNIDLQAIYRICLRYLTLNIENARLSLTERLTILLSSVAFFLIALIFCTIAVVFFTSAIGHMLEESMAIEWVYSIIGAIYLSIVAVLFLLRRKLLLDPICRFLSKLIAEPPAEIPANNTSNPS